jgi:predicted TIM-barrel fold metal-dependent hydrolase
MVAISSYHAAGNQCRGFIVARIGTVMRSSKSTEGSAKEYPCNRRTALQVAAAATLSGVGALSRSARGGELDLKKLPYIDAHSHLWSPDVEKWPLANKQTRADLAPPSFTPEELLKLAEPEGVGRAVLIQHHIYHGWDNTYLIDCAKRMPGRFMVTGMVDDTQPHPDQVMRELLPKAMRGVRITPRIRGEKWLEGDGMTAMWRCGADTGQAMCCLIDAQDLPGVEAMCRKHPQTPVVIDHFARIGVDGEIRKADLEALCALAKHKKVDVKISAYYALGKKQPPYDDLAPMIRRILDAFGPERCMWASDSPYQVQGEHTYAASIALVRDRLDFLSAGDRQWLLGKTAERVYFS